MNRLIFYLIIIALISGCKKPSKSAMDCTSPPPDLALSIRDIKNSDLLSPQALGTFKDSVAVYYIKGQSFDTLQSFIEQLYDVNKNKFYVLDMPSIGLPSVTGIKIFYLRRSHSVIDTLYADYENQTINGCACIPINEVKFNGTHINEISNNPGYYYLAIDKDSTK